MDRRDFLKHVMQSGAALCVFGISSCGQEPLSSRRGRFATGMGAQRVILYDTYAMALYMDGGLGPRTGILKVDYILANEPVEMTFWHGHGGVSHQFTVTPEHFKLLKKMKKVTIETTSVADHMHKLFIDPVDPQWRVKDAVPVEVPDDDSRFA